MKLGDLLNDLAGQAGLPKDHKALVDFLSSSEKANIEVPDEITSAINKNLFNFDSAKNRLDLKTHFKAEVLNGIDKRIEDVATTMKLTDEQRQKLGEEKNSYAKI